MSEVSLKLIKVPTTHKRRQMGKKVQYLTSWESDDTQLVQKFETLWGAEYAPKNDILYHRLCKLDRFNNSNSEVHKRDADLANDREKAKKQKKRPYKNKCILCNNAFSITTHH